MLVINFLLLLPAIAYGWECGLRYDDRSDTVVPWADLLPVGTHISMCNTTYTNSNQPSDIQAVGFATSAFCFGVCTGQDEFCKPQAVADVTETVSIECPGSTREFEMTRVGGCECAASSGSSGPYTPPACYKRTYSGPPAHLSLYMGWCESLGSKPATHDECQVGTGCSGGTPNCLPVNIVKNNATFRCPMFNQESVCTGGDLGIMCPPGTVINVVDAIYGAPEAFMTCPDAGAGTVDPDCQNATETTPIVEGICNGEETCMFTVVNNGSLGADLCPGVDKHLRVTYFCTPMLTGVVCEDTYGSISCPGDLAIKLYRFTYGRPYPEPTCPPGGLEPDPPCYTHIPLTELDGCEGFNSCGGVLNETEPNWSKPGFTNPCPGLINFGVIDYICTPVVSWWSIDTNITSPITATVHVEYDSFDTCDCQA